jgi:hypothetical protein
MVIHDTWPAKVLLNAISTLTALKHIMYPPMQESDSSCSKKCKMEAVFFHQDYTYEYALFATMQDGLVLCVFVSDVTVYCEMNCTSQDFALLFMHVCYEERARAW